ncbi:MAG TPA: radical SAM protein [Gemmatimonadaceae bacterium]|nr:radical SAM protein [Gemmatimonadaceae bacterium]
MTATLRASTFRQELTAAALRERRPFSCTFEITPACNLRCHFCYVSIDPYRGPYLGLEQIKQVLDVLERAGVLWLTLTGGEILSRRDFAEIYTEAHSRGFLITLFTNATLVSPRIAELLRSRPPYGVEASIYGADAAHYEGTTGIPGSFARFERGIDLLRGAGVRLLLKHPISTLTVDHVSAIREWCASRRIGLKLAPELERRHDGGAEPTVYRLETRRAVALRAELSGGAAGDGLPMAECAIGADEPGAAARLYQCAAGRASFFIDALGQASHCVLEREPAFPILSMPWGELWEQMGTWVNQPLPSDAPCSGCDLRRGCNNCPARARLATGSSFQKDPHVCEVTHALSAARSGATAAVSAGVTRRPATPCAR